PEALEPFTSCAATGHRPAVAAFAGLANLRSNLGDHLAARGARPTRARIARITPATFGATHGLLLRRRTRAHQRRARRARRAPARGAVPTGRRRFPTARVHDAVARSRSDPGAAAAREPDRRAAHRAVAKTARPPRGFASAAAIAPRPSPCACGQPR